MIALLGRWLRLAVQSVTSRDDVTREGHGKQDDPTKLSRRKFLRGLAIGGAGALLVKAVPVEVVEDGPDTNLPTEEYIKAIRSELDSRYAVIQTIATTTTNNTSGLLLLNGACSIEPIQQDGTANVSVPYWFVRM